MKKIIEGQLSIHSENIFPIIKKWLYSDHDIFLRELVSNGCDAITKLKKLEIMGQAELKEDDTPALHIRCSAKSRTLSVEDNGLGMSGEEVERYINQIAFSGAADFLEKYKDKANDDQIIGHFGLGFYSAFMVADKVTIDTLSWEKDAEAVHWESEGGTDFTMEPGSRTERGTKITLYLSEDSYEFSNAYRLREVLEKYCAFMPYPIYLENLDKENDAAADGDAADAQSESETPVNDPNPLWLKNPSECSEEDYKAFYRKLFKEWKDPLFTIHLNMDYPFNLKGLLYFPKLNLETEPAEGTIKLFSNQVFIADNIKEVIPEFLLLLKGVIDCPDLPLNVSRSALQNDGFVKKIADYITKKVADKLTGLFRVERESYEKYWEDISPFIKYGCLKDDKFSEKIREAIIYKNLAGQYVSLDEYLEHETEEEQEDGDPSTAASDDACAQDDTEKKASDDPSEDTKKNGSTDVGQDEAEKKVIYYVTDPVQQATYVNMFRQAKQDALLFTHAIDEPFISRLEQRYAKYRFCRVDGELGEGLTRKISGKKAKEAEEKLSPVFRSALGREDVKLSAARFKNKDVAAVITYAEESRRMSDMFKLYGMDPSQLPREETLVLNSEHPLVNYLENNPDGDKAPLVAHQIYDLALMAHKPLSAEEMTAFSKRSLEILEALVIK